MCFLETWHFVHTNVAIFLVTILHQSCHSVQNNVVILSHNNVAILFMTTLPPLLVFYCHSPDIVSCKHIYRPPPSHTMNMCCFKFKCNEIRDDLQWPCSIYFWRMIHMPTKQTPYTVVNQCMRLRIQVFLDTSRVWGLFLAPRSLKSQCRKDCKLLGKLQTPN